MRPRAKTSSTSGHNSCSPHPNISDSFGKNPLQFWPAEGVVAGRDWSLSLDRAVEKYGKLCFGEDFAVQKRGGRAWGCLLM